MSHLALAAVFSKTAYASYTLGTTIAILKHFIRPILFGICKQIFIERYVSTLEIDLDQTEIKKNPLELKQVSEVIAVNMTALLEKLIAT